MFLRKGREQISGKKEGGRQNIREAGEGFFLLKGGGRELYGERCKSPAERVVARGILEKTGARKVVRKTKSGEEVLPRRK